MSERTPHKPPGFLRAGVDADVMMMICTAGHVDHGKTRLVRLLTGCETDRLKEEQNRGLTIELGYAPCMLGGDISVGIVDVPGHEKFIRTMVAGVSGIEMTVLVVAADDGVMPQTVEHVRIMQIMGIERGIVALTKTDLVDKRRLDEAMREVRTFIDGTFLAGAPICPVSSETFEGYPEFYNLLVREATALKKRMRYGVFRMPVAHVFSRAGHGVVVTGIPVAGSVSVGDSVETVPGGQTGRVRGLQRFLRDTGDGEYGQCLALNIPDFSRKPPVRGSVIGAPGYLTPIRTVHSRITSVPGLVNPVRNAEEITFHTGTAEIHGKVFLLEGKTLPDNTTGFASVVLDEPMVSAAHDRFIIRRPSPPATIAGGEVLMVSDSADKPRKRMIADLLTNYTAFMDGTDPLGPEGCCRRIEYFLREHSNEMTADEIAKHVLLTREMTDDILFRLCNSDTVVSLGGGYYVHSDVFTDVVEEIRAHLERALEQNGKISINATDIMTESTVSQHLRKAAIDELESRGIIQKRGNSIILTSADNGFAEEEKDLIKRIVTVYKNAEFLSPRPDELPDILDEPQNRIDRFLEYLYHRGDLLRLSKNVILSRDAFLKAQKMVVDIIRENDVLDSADFKQHIGSSRKFALAILDYLDTMRVTIRSGNDRVLSPDYERNLLI